MRPFTFDGEISLKIRRAVKNDPLWAHSALRVTLVTQEGPLLYRMSSFNDHGQSGWAVVSLVTIKLKPECKI